MTDAVSHQIAPAALVTGGGRRIGLRISERLADAGYAVVLHCGLSSREDAERAAARLKTGGARAAALSLDLADPECVGALIAAAGAVFGPLTLLVNNASIFERDLAVDFTAEIFDRHMAVNLRAPSILARDFANQSPPGVDSSIVNIVDQRVLRLTPEYFSYTLSKAALWTATLTLAQAFAPRGVRVNAVAPGPVFPNANEGDAGFSREIQGLPLGRAVNPDDIADAVLYLARARNVTGQMIAVDAGQHLA